MYTKYKHLCSKNLKIFAITEDELLGRIEFYYV